MIKTFSNRIKMVGAIFKLIIHFTHTHYKEGARLGTLVLDTNSEILVFNFHDKTLNFRLQFAIATTPRAFHSVQIEKDDHQEVC